MGIALRVLFSFLMLFASVPAGILAGIGMLLLMIIVSPALVIGATLMLSGKIVENIFPHHNGVDPEKTNAQNNGMFALYIMTQLLFSLLLFLPVVLATPLVVIIIPIITSGYVSGGLAYYVADKVTAQILNEEVQSNKQWSGYKQIMQETLNNPPTWEEPEQEEDLNERRRNQEKLYYEKNNLEEQKNNDDSPPIQNNEGNRNSTIIEEFNSDNDEGKHFGLS